MRAEVEEHAVSGAAGLLPGVGALDGTEAIEVGFDSDNAAESRIGTKLADSEEVSIVTTVVEGGENFAGVVGGVDQFARLLGCGRKRLVDDHVFSGLKSAEGNVEVRVIGRGDNDEVDVRRVDCLVDAAQDLYAGIIGRGFIAAALDDGGKFKPWDRGDEGGVENLAGYTVCENGGAYGG